MKCPLCNAWTSVKETRETAGGRTRRSRLCANGHTFPTYETPPPRPRLLALRNRHAAALVLAGMTQTDAAKRMRMPRCELSRYMTAKHPEFNARSAGQTRRWGRT